MMAGNSAGVIMSGAVSYYLQGSNVWLGGGGFARSDTASSQFLCNGSVALSGTLDRVRITTVNGTDTFDAGTINIMWE
jgi:hypothetical protein